MMGKIFYGMTVVKLILVNYQEKVMAGVNILVKFTTDVRSKTYTWLAHLQINRQPITLPTNPKPMKRFLVFAGDCYYPEGGMNDFQDDFDTLEEARSFEAKIKKKLESDWGDLNWHDFNWTRIWDSETRTHV